MNSHKSTAPLPLFVPADGHLISSPTHAGPGYWVGAPTVLHDPSSERFYLASRRRRPRDQAADRGYEATISESSDGLEFREVWKVRKTELDSSSIEKCCLLRGHDGIYRYYLSYVDPEDQRWRIDVLESERPDDFEVTRRQPVLTAAQASAHQVVPVEGVKDPNVYRFGGLYFMFLSYAEGHAAGVAEPTELHETSDVYNTGHLIAPSALAISTDGVHFRWQGQILPVGGEGAWDCYQARLGSVLQHGGLWYGFYDGSASARENYEERFGLAQSFDLRHWNKITIDEPLLTVPWSTGSVRYVDALPVGGEIHYYYEMVREDGAHELRCAVVPA